MGTGWHRDIALLIARVGIGIIFVAHGWQKLNDQGIEGVQAFFTSINAPLPEISAYVVTYLELVGGALLIIGALTPLVGFLLFCDMVGAFVLVHAEHGVFVNDGGYELVLALGVGSLLIAACGAGRLSVDRMIPGLNRFS
ncbi:DoxX family protein [Hoyosella altamirensis]|uniref:Putative oxidoreductase n=1 Tax=Hoyosella altamirensis TaxID=616997 RepID=A0A839RH46_9ACTN|nr:DoxX family protein [Hoyosella altamirensis]MBB3035935.1 putative oxidoreductase [Hoyosella altamirensis]